MSLLRKVLETGIGQELDDVGELLGMHRSYMVIRVEKTDDAAYRERLLQHPTVKLLFTYLGN